MSERWSIPAPVWDEYNYLRLANGERLGLIETSDLMHFDAYASNGVGRTFRMEAEARAWVEAEVMKALGAEVME